VRLSVIIPAFNEEKLLPRCLEHVAAALGAVLERGWEVETVVCDNNSTDATAEVARRAGVRVVFEPVNQISRARNAGAAAATGDWLLFIDADAYPDAALFRAIAGVIEGGQVIGGGALVRLDSVGWVAGWMTGVWNGISRWNRWMAGSCVFCDAAVFRALGGFSEELYASEEIEFSRRLKRVAKTSDRRVVILAGHRLASSGRKLAICHPSEYARLFWRTVMTGGGNLRRRDGLGIWYDGRR
jgi:glycosyltransferase involved in cell wall biosynthesis